MQVKINKKQKKAILYSIDEAKKNKLWKYIDSIYLFGSCAKGNSRYNSDVDLLYLFNLKNLDVLHDEIIYFLGNTTANREGMSTIDVVVDSAYTFYNSVNFFNSEIKKDMICIYKKEV